jgi:hypothetical protein
VEVQRERIEGVQPWDVYLRPGCPTTAR